MNKLNEKIAEILKQHPEGEDFFNALDAMVRGDLDILTAFLDFVGNRIDDYDKYSLILTGQFGIAMMNVFGARLLDNFADVILVNGGIRKGAEPVIYREKLKGPRFIMFDDSFYSGTTRDSIEKKLRTLNSQATIEKTFVIYDGSVKIQKNVFSMFRYHSDKPLWTNDLVNI